MSKASILFADDDADILRNAELMLDRDFLIRTALSISRAKTILKGDQIDVAVIDLNFEGQELDGLSFLKFIFEDHPRVPVVVLSNDSNTRRVVAATNYRLAGFVTKVGDFESDLKIAINRALEDRDRVLKGDGDRQYFPTKSPKVHRLLDAVDKIASSPTDSPLLINGESGTGKEVLARYVARRLRKPIVAANMANIGRDVAESELFGHLKGAFTGAVANKTGLFEAAHTGIFFLDELGECPIDVQAKLLRAIQEREIQPVGSTTPKSIDVRFIGATNRSLEEMVADGRFREDLYYRLNVIQLSLPPLRDRPEDIVFYSNRFLEEFAGGRRFNIESSGLDALMSHVWPGNVRELRNLIERFAILSDSRTLDGDIVVKLLATPNRGTPGNTLFSVKAPPSRGAVLEVLERTRGNRSHAATLMGVHRTTLLRWIKDMDLGSLTHVANGRPRVGKIER